MRSLHTQIRTAFADLQLRTPRARRWTATGRFVRAQAPMQLAMFTTLRGY